MAAPDRDGNRFAVPESIHYRQFDDELVLLDLAHGQYYSLNAVGARMWHALAGGKSPAQVADDLALEYDAPADALLRDCLAMVSDLLVRGLLERRTE